METSVDRFGRILIPKRVRDDFNLKAGTLIRIEESDQAIILTPCHGEPSLKVKEGVLVYSGTSVEDIGDALARHREERVKSIGK